MRAKAWMQLAVTLGLGIAASGCHDMQRTGGFFGDGWSGSSAVKPNTTNNAANNAKSGQNPAPTPFPQATNQTFANNTPNRNIAQASNLQQPGFGGVQPAGVPTINPSLPGQPTQPGFNGVIPQQPVIPPMPNFNPTNPGQMPGVPQMSGNPNPAMNVPPPIPPGSNFPQSFQQPVQPGAPASFGNIQSNQRTSLPQQPIGFPGN